MTAPIQRDGNGFAILPGGYQPPAAPGQPAAAPMQPPQARPIQFQPPPQPMNWRAPGPPGAPIEGAPPNYPQPVQQPAPPGAYVHPLQQPGVVQPPQAAGTIGGDLNVRLDGPNAPAEIRGKTLGEALQIYGGMRQLVLQGIPGPGAPAPIQQPPVVQPPTGQQPPQQGQWDWRNPEASIDAAVGRVIDQKLMPALAPLVHNNALNAINAARNQVAARIPGFTSIEPEVMQALQGADPATLSRPEMWQTAAETVMGRRMLRGQQGQPAAMPVGPGGAPPNPSPNLGGFYTEAPTVGSAPGAAPQLNANQMYVAQAMGMSAADYLAWSGGVQGGGR